MKTVLIVEDEKMIRQGIKSIIQRSGIPVETVIECNNGEMALEILKEQNVDVMFTDIRMPKMDGIELVKRMQELDHIPLTVAISGYDDFTYAVEMLRCGVREYLLKPVERDKITEILKKLNEELEQKQKKETTMKRLGYQQIRHLLLLEGDTEEEVRTLELQYGEEFYKGDYVVCCQNAKERTDFVRDRCIYLPGIGEHDIFIVSKERAEELLENELSEGFMGISGVHAGFADLREAYLESVKMRKKAFCRNQKRVSLTEEEERIPESLVQEAAKLLSDSAKMQRVQLIGTDRREDLERAWQQFFYEVERGRIAPEQYEECIREFFCEIEKTYRNALEDMEALQERRYFFQKDCISEYEKELLPFLFSLQEAVGSQFHGNRNKQKIQQALEYMEENYGKDLNMAVVSNHISMNYSLFSYAFKQYTGSNFVNYLKELRMSKAKELLLETDLRIVEISRQAGYDNEKHFMKIFKASCGVSPSEYRKNMKKTDPGNNHSGQTHE